MPNIIQLQDDLKGYSDAQLKEEIGQPSGTAPGYLVLSEMRRREQMRKAYEGEAERYGHRKGTIAERYAGRSGSQPAIETKAGLGALAGGAVPQGFAEGGQVGRAPSYTSRYEGVLTGLGSRPDHTAGLLEQLAALSEEDDERKKGALTNALIRAGLGMAASKDPHIMSAIAEGGIAGLDAHRNSLDAVRKSEVRRLGIQAQLGAASEAQNLARIQTATDVASSEHGAGATEARLALAEKEGVERQRQYDSTYEQRDRFHADTTDLSLDKLDLAREGQDVATELGRGKLDLAQKTQEADEEYRDRAIAVQEGQLDQLPADARNIEHFLAQPPAKQAKILEFFNAKRGTNYDRKDMNTASSAWGSIAKEVRKQLEDDPSYAVLSFSEDPTDKANAEKMLAERTREEFMNRYPQYADMIQFFGQATSARLDSIGKPGGLKIVDRPDAEVPIIPLSPLAGQEAPPLNGTLSPVPGSFPRTPGRGPSAPVQGPLPPPARPPEPVGPRYRRPTGG